MSIYGLIIGIAFVIGLQIFQKKEKLLPSKTKNLYPYFLVLLSIIGARIYYVLFNWNYYSLHPSEIINTRAGGLGILGGIIAVSTYTFFLLKKHKINFVRFFDQFIFILPLCQSIGRWGNYFNHEIYNSQGQPIWLYESILDLILFFILLKTKSKPTAKYLISFGFIRFVTEFLRDDIWIINNLKIGQIISIAFIVIGIFIAKKKPAKNE